MAIQILQILASILTTFMFSSTVLNNEAVKGELSVVPLWNATGNQNQSSDCSLETNITNEIDVITFTGDPIQTCGIQLEAPSKGIATLIEIPPWTQSDSFLYAEKQGELMNCKHRFMVITGHPAASCNSILWHSQVLLFIQGNANIDISEVQINRPLTGCPDDAEQSQVIPGVSQTSCNIVSYEHQIPCILSPDNICSFEFPPLCNASLGYRNVEFQCPDIQFNHIYLLVYSFDINVLDLAYHNIVDIDESHFENLNLLEDLTLDFNKLSDLHSGLFRGLINLKYLYLNGNQLTNLDVVLFHNLKKLKILFLTKNMLTTLPEGLFQDLSNLEELHLSNNNLVSLHQNLFSNLRSLKILKAYSNKLEGLPSGVFHDLHNLTGLYLYKNQITSVDENLFNGTTKLNYLSMGDNNLNSLPKELFRGLESLKSLRLYKNQLTVLPPGLFKGLKSLTSLALYANLIRSLDEDVFKETSELSDLSIGDNQLTDLPKRVFKGLRNLKSLKLYGNQIGSVDKDLLSDTQLFYLSMGDNNLTLLENGFLQRLNNLRTLKLYKNKIRFLGENLFEDTSELIYLSLLDNRLEILPKYLFRGLHKLQQLLLFLNRFRSLESEIFQDLSSLNDLFLFTNQLITLPYDIFLNLRNIEVLRLDENHLTELYYTTFKGLRNLKILILSSNKLEHLDNHLFQDLEALTLIDLSGNKLKDIPRVGNLRHLESLAIHENKLTRITGKAFVNLSKETNVLVSQEEVCECYVPNDISCNALDDISPYLTCKRLLSDRILMAALWIIGFNAIFGNLFVLIWRKVRAEGNKIQTFLLTNLAISDLLMGVYMIIIGSADIHFDKYFPLQAETWRSGTTCRVAGTIAIVSTEASMFFVTLISINRFIQIRRPLSKIKFGKNSSVVVVAILWLISLALGLVPSLLAGTDDKFYDNSHVCIGLPLAKVEEVTKNQTSEKVFIDQNSEFYDHYFFESSVNSTSLGLFSGKYFAVAMFLGLNSICYLTVLFCYVQILRFIRSATTRTGADKEIKEQIRMSARVAALVLTNFLCWFPIILLGILVQTDVVILPPSVFAWCVTFVLPINSALNPYLYTISAIVSDRSKSKETELHVILTSQQPLQGSVNPQSESEEIFSSTNMTKITEDEEMKS